MATFILLGISGSGRDTFAKRLAEKLDITHLRLGDVIRQEIQKRTDLGIEITTFVDRGEVVPISLLTLALANRVKNLEGDIIISGFPITVEQAIALDEVLLKYNSNVSVLRLAIDIEVLLLRMQAYFTKKQVVLDDRVALKNRAIAQIEAMDSLADYYEVTDRYYHIDANEDMDTVFEYLTNTIKTIKKRNIS